jgi:hypothetical protein
MNQIGLINLKTELPKFLKENNFTGDDAKQVTKLLTNANQNQLGKKEDEFVTDFEVGSCIKNNPEISKDLGKKVLNALYAWDSAGAKDFQTKLETPKEISVTKFTGGAREKTIAFGEGNITLGNDKYDFRLYNADLIRNPSEPRMELRLTDSQGNSISLDQEHIPESFIQKVIDKQPPNSPVLK